MATYTKEIALTDSITIDSTDASDGFRSFGLTSEDQEVDASGFNATGSDETLSGKRAQSFTGEAFYTPEMYALLYPLYRDRDIFAVTWQPSGLVDNTRETYTGNCQLRSFSPAATRGDVRVFACTFSAADSAGITSSMT